MNLITFATVTVPNPTPTQPPGGGGLMLILGWASWIIFGIAVLAILISAGKMMLDSRAGRGGGEAATGLMWVLIGSIIAAVASGIIGAIVVAAQS
ncbi:hypothetical protein ACL9RL_18365 [Plantibacter sp. Mn2098]|uniref:hypothetical protein n=1 Tax=Plantibacter sp. Mn2098 TaxID=3395266 RepID=UPI003BD14854